MAAPIESVVDASIVSLSMDCEAAKRERAARKTMFLLLPRFEILKNTCACMCAGRTYHSYWRVLFDSITENFLCHRCWHHCFLQHEDCSPHMQKTLNVSSTLKCNVIHEQKHVNLICNTVHIFENILTRSCEHECESREEDEDRESWFHYSSVTKIELK